MSEAAAVKDEPFPSDITSANPLIDPPNVGPPAVPSAAVASAKPSSPRTADKPIRRASLPEQEPEGDLTGAPPTLSRTSKSKKKKGGGAGAAAAGGAAAGENTGRWTAEEHRLFLQGLEQHGKGWKKIASLIKSRTVVQIRTHAQKYFQKLAKARQNGEEGDVCMEGRGGISTLTSAATAAGGLNVKRRRHQVGTKRKAIHSVVASAQREGKRLAAEGVSLGVPNPVPPLPAVSPILANFLLPETSDSNNRSSLGSSSTTSQGTISGPALEDSIFRFLTPTPVTAVDSTVNDVARQAGANPITLPSDHPSSAPSVGGEISPTGVADLSLYPSWTDGKDPPLWYTKGADVEALLDVADTLDWLADPGDPNESFQAPEVDVSSSAHIGEIEITVAASVTAQESAPPKDDEGDEAEVLSAADGPVDDDVIQELVAVADESVDIHEVSDHQLPSIFDGAPESSDHLAVESTSKMAGAPAMCVSESTDHLGEATPEIEEPLFDTPIEEHDFVSTILEHENEGSDLTVLG